MDASVLDAERASELLKQEIADRQRAEKRQSALLRIATMATSAADLQQLYTGIHRIVAELMYAENLYIAFYHPAAQTVNFDYYVDEKRPFLPPRRAGRGITEYLLRTGKPLLATPERLEELERTGEVVRTGPRSLDWMGVPLKNETSTFGALAVQTYKENVRYTEQDLEVLNFVSQQIAHAIEHKRNQQALAESESKFRALAESAVPAIFIYDRERLLYVNPATEKIFGYTGPELRALSIEGLLGKSACAILGARSVPARHEIEAPTRLGEQRWFDLSTNAIQFEGRSAIIATAVDITDRKRGQRLQSALYQIADQASSAEDLTKFYKAIHGIVGELMYAENFFVGIFDRGSRAISFPYAVDSADKFPEPGTPVPLGEALSARIFDAEPPVIASPEIFLELMRRAQARGGRAPVDWLGVPLRKGTGETFGVLVLKSYSESIRFTETDREILTFVSQQVASAIEHKHNQEAVRASEERFRLLVQRAVYGIYRSSVDGRFLAVNPAMVQMLGYASAEEVLRLNLYADIYDNPEDRNRLAHQYLQTHHIENEEVRWRRRDGGRFLVRLSGRAILSQRGEAEAFEMIAEDVTERRALEERLRQVVKMEAVGRLAGGVAHDFNNLLTIIQGYSEVLLNDLQPTDPIRNDLLEIKKAADRAASLTAQLLTFSRQQVQSPAVLDLNAIVRNMTNLLRRILGEDVAFFAGLAPNLGSIKADVSQIEQVIMNLAVNARDAMPRGGKLLIETANVAVDANFARDHVGLKPGDYVRLSATDNGIGMDEETRARVFEPFFTTKEQGKGTGLGLATVYGVVKQSNGYIWVESAPGKGASFKVYFPRIDIPAADASAGPPSSPIKQRASGTVLLVEDEDGVRHFVRNLLEREGYTVLEARGGDDAMRQCRSHDGPIHILLTDVVLEHMSGRELSEKLASMRPEMKVVYMSGYTDDAMVHHGVFSQRAAFLQKPFTTQALMNILREVLGEKR